MTYNWSNKKLLVVEDNDFNCLLLKHVLEDTGINIVFAMKSNEFIEYIETNTYDLILMDIHLGEKTTGIDLIKHLHSNNIDIPVIIQSACDDDYLHYNNINYFDIIRKPLDIDILLNLINNAFN
jgi:CheY-like chemotaxis protein